MCTSANNLLHTFFYSYYLQLPFLPYDVSLVQVNWWLFHATHSLSLSHSPYLSFFLSSFFFLSQLRINKTYALDAISFSFRWLWITNKNLRQCHGNIKSFRYILFYLFISVLSLLFFFRCYFCEKLFTATVQIVTQKMRIQTIIKSQAHFQPQSIEIE